MRYLVSYFAKTDPNLKIRKTLEDIRPPVSPELLPAEKGQISQLTESIIGPYDRMISSSIIWYGGVQPGKDPTAGQCRFKDFMTRKRLSSG